MYQIGKPSKWKAQQLNLALKIELSKAFDKIEWPYLITNLQNFYFLPHFIFLIQKGLITTKISIRYNQTKTTYFKPTRGLRQGGPFSPPIFIILIQGLTNIIEQFVHVGHWKPIIINRKPLHISHLALADDILLFFQRTNDSVNAIWNVLHIFSTCSSQEVNAPKSKILFNAYSIQNFKNSIYSILNMGTLKPEDKYLGIPISHLRRKIQLFPPLLHNVMDKMVV